MIVLQSVDAFEPHLARLEDHDECWTAPKNLQGVLELAVDMAPEFRTLVCVRPCIYFHGRICPSVSVLNF